MCNLHFSYRPINIQRPMRMYSYGIRGCKTWCECSSNNCLCWLRNRHSQRSDNSVARLRRLSMSFPFRTGLVVENTIFGTQQAVWKERLWGKSVLEENIRTVAFTTGGSLRLFCVRIFIQSSERQASGTVLRLPARKLYWCRLHFCVCSEYTA